MALGSRRSGRRAGAAAHFPATASVTRAHRCRRGPWGGSAHREVNAVPPCCWATTQILERAEASASSPPTRRGGGQARRRPDRTTGFAHGTASRSPIPSGYTSTRAMHVSSKQPEEAIAYEDTGRYYSTPHRVDYAELGDPLYLTQWCRGAAGIGLARLRRTERPGHRAGARRHRARPTGRPRVRSARAGSTLLRQSGPGPMLLLSAGRRRSRPELTDEARTTAWRVLNRAQRRGGFVLDPTLAGRRDAPPGFFKAQPASATSCCGWRLPTCHSAPRGNSWSGTGASLDRQMILSGVDTSGIFS